MREYIAPTVIEINLDRRGLSTKKGGCLMEAWDLLEASEQSGVIYYVDQICGISIIHFYVILDNQSDSDFALNQADNDFEGYPRLTVAQVKKYGSVNKIDANITVAV